jgi:hypothetical protein
MTIIRWDPYRDVVALQNRMNSLFQDFPEWGKRISDRFRLCAPGRHL